MGKKSKGLIGVRPRTMHDICSSQNNKKKKKLRDSIKMKSYEQIVSKVKVDKIEKTIKELQAKDRVGRLEHDDYIKLMANRKVLKKKQEKAQGSGQKMQGADMESYHYTAEEIRTGKFCNEHKTDPLLDEDFGKNLMPGYEPNSSLQPTGMRAKALGNFVTQGTVSRTAVIYSQSPPQPKPVERPVQKEEDDPLVSMKFENEIIHRKIPKEKQPVAKLVNSVLEKQKEENKEEVKEKKMGAKRTMMVPASVKAAKRRKEEPTTQKAQEIKTTPEVKEAKTITSVPAPENLMLLDLSDESDEETEKRKDLKELLDDFS
eukprot:TRINITY_DN12483_c0_g1_i1.p2 TRINITY_DN12483_c0_g1~~TRINITY_DN12483_c0_g1_i1.p2  ORF type:complete len:317 (-),score=122.47 TRINITY_DN12483_c0_g1_i1:150-1100(-)